MAEENSVCALILGGEFAPLDGINDAAFIIACDKGYLHASENAVVPDLLVGDFDSYTGALPEGIKRLDLPVEKDDTDTMAAIRCAIDKGFKRLILYCALGGRLDHLLGNLQAAAFAVKHGARVKICAGRETAYFIGDGSLTLKKGEHHYFSILSLSDRCDNISIDGAKYSLSGAVLDNTFPIGVSNEWKDSEVTISLGNGVLMVLVEDRE